MKFVDEFRDKNKAEKLIKVIEKIANNKVNLMEVCGTHTVAIFKHGIRTMLPTNVKLLSGPGCPVCVTPGIEIERIIRMSKRQEVIIVTFGDMMKVPGITTNLEKIKTEGQDIRVVYSPLEALTIAEKNKEKKVIFFGVGFETTTPCIATTIIEADKRGTSNFFVYSCHKVVPPAMQALLSDKKININGFICPGHVSTIIGSYPYEFIPAQYHIPCVIAGFEPLDILQAIVMLLKQLNEGRAKVEIQYTRAVRPEGNLKALELLNEVFEPTDSLWRGIGIIPDSGLKIRKKYQRFDAQTLGIPEIEEKEDEQGCLCGSVLKGIITPYDCRLFAKKCTPENPIGPCMVSTEGTCAAYYKYGKRSGISRF